MISVDKVFLNGRIYTMEAEGSVVEAIAVYDGKYIFAGTTEEARKIPAKEVIDLQGKTVIPGFTDTHCHLAEMAEAPAKIDLLTARSMDDVVAMLEKGLKDLPEGGWIVGYNLLSALLKENRLPNRYDLDRVSTKVPVFVSSNCLHNFMGNSKLLELADIKKGYDGPCKELLVVDEDGEPTGNFREHGLLPRITASRPSLLGNHQETLDAMAASINQCAKWGYTTLHTYDGFGGSELDKLSSYQELERDGKLNARVIVNRVTGVNNSLDAISGLGNDKVKYGAVKLFADGTYAEYSAYLQEPYEDNPSTCGRQTHEPEEMYRLVKEAYQKGNDVAIHIIGDGSLKLAMDIVEDIYDPNNKAHFEFIHCHLTTPKLLERIAKYPIIVNMQPIFVKNQSTCTVHERIGYEREKYFHAFKSFLDYGIVVTGGTDGPISNQNPLVGIQCAVTRETYDGSIFQPQERLTIYQAVSLYTKNAAYAAHEESKKGTIQVGKLADFLVLDRDIFATEPEKISNIQILNTYLGGEAVKI